MPPYMKKKRKKRASVKKNRMSLERWAVYRWGDRWQERSKKKKGSRNMLRLTCTRSYVEETTPCRPYADCRSFLEAGACTC